MRHPLDTGPLSDEDIQPPRDYAPRNVDVRVMNQHRDWIAIGTAIMAMIVNGSAVIWWASSINQRVGLLEDHDKARATQASDIAVIKSQIGDIKAWVDRQQDKEDGKSR